MTSVAGAFASEDLVRCPDLVVRAMRDSGKATAGIHNYLSSQNVLTQRSGKAGNS